MTDRKWFELDGIRFLVWTPGTPFCKAKERLEPCSCGCGSLETINPEVEEAAKSGLILAAWSDGNTIVSSDLVE